MIFFPRKLISAGFFIVVMLAASPHPGAFAQGQAPSFAGGETLKYKLLWPSNISLGEAVFRVSSSQGTLHFEVTMEADLPTRSISGLFTSSASREDLCSLEFQSKVTEGVRTSEESIQFDQKNHQATKISHGQSSSVAIPNCARDPVTFLYYLRKQLAAGSSVDAATFFLGLEQSLEVKTDGSDTVTVRGQQQTTDKYLVNYNGQNSARSFELWFSKDARREPVMIRLPFPLAVFSAEIE